jgi:hypothetical protein
VAPCLVKVDRPSRTEGNKKKKKMIIYKIILLPKNKTKNAKTTLKEKQEKYK